MHVSRRWGLYCQVWGLSPSNNQQAPLPAARAAEEGTLAGREACCSYKGGVNTDETCDPAYGSDDVAASSVDDEEDFAQAAVNSTSCFDTVVLTKFLETTLEAAEWDMEKAETNSKVRCPCCRKSYVYASQGLTWSKQMATNCRACLFSFRQRCIVFHFSFCMVHHVLRRLVLAGTTSRNLKLAGVGFLQVREAAQHAFTAIQTWLEENAQE